MLCSSGDKPLNQFLLALLKFLRTLESVMEEADGKLKGFAHKKVSSKPFYQ